MASILPTSHHYNKNRHSFLYRLFRFPHMDFEYALWQMGYLLIAPRRVYRNMYHHKQTKNQWSRDDPAFIVLLTLFISISGMVWSITYDVSTIKTVLYMICCEFLSVGCVIATLTWYITNTFLTQNINAYAIAQKVEWQYAFDVHCNSFLPVFIIHYIIQWFFLPLLLKDNWISMWVGNIMYGVSLMWYIWGTFLGFHALPFLVHTELLLYPMALCIIVFMASLFGINISHIVIFHNKYK